MGEARRRKAALGHNYGTPDFAKDQSLKLRDMTPDEMEQLDLLSYSTNPRYRLMVGSVAGNDCPLLVKAALDAAGQINSYVTALIPKGSTVKILTGSRRAADHNAINRYLMEHTDVIIVNEAH